jgi:hypothetical protein
MPHPSHSSIQNTTQFKQFSVSVELQHCDMTSCSWYKFVEEYADSIIKSKLMYLGIHLEKTHYPTQIAVLNLLLPVKCSLTGSVLIYLYSAHPGNQVDTSAREGALAGHSITCNISMITNMTFSKQNQ